MRRSAKTAGLLMLLASGCTVGPNYQRPQPPQVATWRNGAAGDTSVSLNTDPDPRWWAAFGDPVLTELMETAIHDNLDVQQAVLRVVESRQGIVTARAAGLPHLSGNASYMYDQLGAKGILESQGVYKDLNELADKASSSPIGGAVAGSGVSSGNAASEILNPLTQPQNIFQYGLSASWELDLFGRVRRSVEQARALTQAQAEAANDALTSLESEVAQAYVQLRGAQALLASQEANIRSARASLDLTESRRAVRISTGLDVDQARTQLLNLQRQLPEYEKQERQAIDRLDILLGRPPGTLEERLLQPAPLPGLHGAVGLGVPSTLARRRPDIREAEAQLHAATAGVGVAVASFYPDVSLTGNLGLRALDAGYLTRWASHFYSAGPSVSLPIFQGGQLSANLRMNRAQAAEAALHYRAAVLNALREVEDGLVAFRADRMERDRLAAVERSGEDTLSLATSRYTHGLSDYLQVLDAQRSVEDARQQLVQQDMTLDGDVVTLYRALGGGWEAEASQSRAPGVAGKLPLTPAAADSLGAVVK